VIARAPHMNRRLFRLIFMPLRSICGYRVKPIRATFLGSPRNTWPAGNPAWLRTLMRDAIKKLNLDREICCRNLSN